LDFGAAKADLHDFAVGVTQLDAIADLMGAIGDDDKASD
jgi:hypothetical protein